MNENITNLSAEEVADENLKKNTESQIQEISKQIKTSISKKEAIEFWQILYDENDNPVYKFRFKVIPGRILKQEDGTPFLLAKKTKCTFGTVQGREPKANHFSLDSIKDIEICEFDD